MSDWAMQVYHHSSEAMPEIPDASVDALVTDPPAGIEFMGKHWDSFKGDKRQPGDATFHQSESGPHNRSTVRYGTSGGYKNASTRQAFIESLRPIFEEALRVLKPGAHGFVWALPRTSHWTMCALEDAGFEIRDVVCHLFGTGFPKSYDVAQSIEKTKTLGRARREDRELGLSRNRFSGSEDGTLIADTGGRVLLTTDEAKQWEGWGTALKPAAEYWVLVRKPLIGTVAANVLRFGTGALNIDASRIAGEAWSFKGGPKTAVSGGIMGTRVPGPDVESHPGGRWPANVTFGEEAAKELDRQSGVSSSTAPRETRGTRPGGFGDVGADKGDPVPCGPMYGDAGAASRFFFVAKPDQGERPKIRRRGEADVAHPTVKPVALMQYLVRMITPPGGIVLDPFAGTGTTFEACESLGFRWVGYEAEETYLPLINQRLRQRGLFTI